MNAWSIFAIVLAIGVIALVGFTIPILIQIKDILKTAERTVTRLEKDVEPVLQNIDGITMNVEGITEAANTFVHRPAKIKAVNEENLVEKIKENVEENTKLIKEEYIPLASKTVKDYYKAFKTGISVGLDTYKHSKPILLPATTKLEVVKKDLMVIPDTTKEIMAIEATPIK